MPARTALFEACSRVRTRSWMLAIFAVGVVVRLSVVVLTLHNGDAARGVPGPETYFIATSLATNGTYADAYGQGVGPTAHTAPLLPIILAVVIKLFGVGFTGYLIPKILAAIFSSGSYALLPALAIKCRLGRTPGVLAGLVGASVPINFYFQTFGRFDAPYSMFGVVGLCLVLSTYWVGRSFPIRGAVYTGAAAGCLCLISPAIMPVLMGWCLIGLVYFTKSRKEFSLFALTVATVLAVCLSPWAYRNYNALGTAVWTRSNFGLELSVSNNDLATADEETNANSPEFPHPFSQIAERIRVHQMGELAYNQVRKSEALAWIRNHPERFSKLTAQRLTYFWFPRMKRWWQAAGEGIVSVLAIVGLLNLLRVKHRSSLLFLPVLLLFPAIYLIIQVGPRYRLPIEPILLLLACCFTHDLYVALREYSKRSPKADHENMPIVS